MTTDNTPGVREHTSRAQGAVGRHGRQPAGRRRMSPPRRCWPPPSPETRWQSRSSAQPPWHLGSSSALLAGALVDRWPRRTVMILADPVRAARVLALAALVPRPRHDPRARHHGLHPHQRPKLPQRRGTSHHPQPHRPQPHRIGHRQQPHRHNRKRHRRIRRTAHRQRIIRRVALGAHRHRRRQLRRRRTSRAVPATAPPQHTGEGILVSIAQATCWMFRHRQLLELGALLIAGGNLATNAAMATFVLYAHQDLGVTTWGFGLLLAAQAIGATLGGWAASRLSKRSPSARCCPSPRPHAPWPCSPSPSQTRPPSPQPA